MCKINRLLLETSTSGSLESISFNSYFPSHQSRSRFMSFMLCSWVIKVSARICADPMTHILDLSYDQVSDFGFQMYSKPKELCYW